VIPNNLRNNSDNKSNNNYAVNSNQRLNSKKVSNSVSQKENIERINNIEDTNLINNNRMNIINGEVSQSQSHLKSNYDIKPRFQSGTISQNSFKNSSNINSTHGLNAYLINQLLEDRDRYNRQGMRGSNRDNFINRNSEIFLQSSNDPDFNFPELCKLKFIKEKFYLNRHLCGLRPQEDERIYLNNFI